MSPRNLLRTLLPLLLAWRARPDPLDVTKTAQEVAALLDNAWKVVHENVDYHGLPPELLDKTEANLLRKVAGITVLIDRANERWGDVGSDTIQMIFNYLPNETRDDLLSLQINIDAIESNYKTLEDFKIQSNDVERLTLEDYAKNIVSLGPYGIKHSLDNLHKLIVPSGFPKNNDGLFKSISKTFQAKDYKIFCDITQSPQQILYFIYNTIALAELKGYALIQLSYMFLRMYSNGNFKTEIKMSKQNFENKTNHAVELISEIMKDTSRDLWKCDPKKHIAGQTYLEMTRVLQGYVQNEEKLNDKGSCWEKCNDYTYTKECFTESQCKGSSSNRCTGKILDCQKMESSIWVAPSNSSSRRYQYIEYKNGKTLGRKENSRGVSRVESFNKWLFWECSYCFCLCDEQGPSSDRYISMRSVISDIKNNMVVTGLRFRKLNRIVHLQIQQGKLLPRGKIDNSTVRWVGVRQFRINDRKVHNYQDYHTLTHMNRALDLDDLEVSDGYVLTGVRFKQIGSHLNFEIYQTAFNYATGNLIDPFGTSHWVDNPNTDSSPTNPRKKLTLFKPDIPTRSSYPSKPDSKSDQYIEFTNSDIDKDAAQTTVPFLDTQSVESSEAVPLAGAGIFHKGQPGFGGFITPKIITYDFSKHVKVPFPKAMN